MTNLEPQLTGLATCDEKCTRTDTMCPAARNGSVVMKTLLKKCAPSMLVPAVGADETTERVGIGRVGIGRAGGVETVRLGWVVNPV
jgi:hypothetical protein